MKKIKKLVPTLPLCLVGIALFAVLYSPTKDTVFTVNSEVKVVISGKHELTTSHSDATVVSDNGYITFVFLNSGYYDAFAELVNDFGYEGSEEQLNNYKYTVYSDDEGVWYYTMTFGSHFAYIYTNNHEWCREILGSTSIYSMD